MKQIDIWGIKINPLKKSEIVQMIDRHISEKDTLFQLTGVNPETIAHANMDPELKEAILHSDVVNIDNMLVVTSLRILGNKIPERAACPDIFELLLALGHERGYSAYFLGAKQQIIDKMAEKLRARYPNLNIAGLRNGYFKKEDEAGIVKEIHELRPDMLFIALPTPQKETFITKYKNQLGAKFAFGVGGAFDVQAGEVVRAPAWMRKIGLEGVHRMVQNPANYGARYKQYYIPFIKLFFSELFRRNHH